jgi:hypothetical protein
MNLDIVTVTELASELLVIPSNALKLFSKDALKQVELLKEQRNAISDSRSGNENPAEKLERVCREFFKKCDDDNSGEISPIEFSRVMRTQAKKFGPTMKEWFNRPLVIFEQIDDDGSGSIDEEEFVEYATTRGDAMMLGLVMGSTAHGDSASAKNIEIAQREATDALVESLRDRIQKLEEKISNQVESMMLEKEKIFNVVAKSCFGEI